MNLNSTTINGFTIGLLAARYDNPKPIPDFHKEMWDIGCSDDPYVAIAAPRGHAKSTAMTHAFVLAMMLFREKSFCLLVSDTEGQAAEFLGDIKTELSENDALKQTFGIRRLLKDTETNIICIMDDGHKFRILAKGSEQKVRGLKWNGKRPDLIVGDDLENDDIVMNPERREKFRKWFMKALLPCGSDTCLVRIVGTILHLDAMLNRLLSDPTWVSKKYEAHNADFSEILWPEQFPKERLMGIRAGYEAQNDLEGYAQEYLNNPIASENAYFNKDYFLDLERDKDGKAYVLMARDVPRMEFYAAADFAISEKEKADYTVIMVAGVCHEGKVHIVDVRRGRWDSEAIIDELISVQRAWKPNIFTFETEKIDKAIGPFLEREMLKTGVFLNINKVTPTKSKTTRGRSIQGMVKARAVHFDKDAEWYPSLENELLTITASGPRGAHDDYFDAFSYIGLTVNQFFEGVSDEEFESDQYDEAFMDTYDMGKNGTTGY